MNLPYAAYLDALGYPIDRAAFVQRDFRTRWVSVRGLLNYLVRGLVRGRPQDALPRAPHVSCEALGWDRCSAPTTSWSGCF